MNMVYLLNNNMKKPGYIYQGILNTHNASVQNYAQTCAELMRNNTDFKLRYTCNMLYWLENPSVELVYPIVIVEHHKGISGVHPGQSRFLAAVLLNRTWPAVVTTVSKHSDILVDKTRILKYPRNHKLASYDSSIERAYMSQSLELEQELGMLSPIEFYSKILAS
jgi:hypothetical protein